MGGATFTISRTPVGDLTYIANVSYYTHQGQSGGSCGASYQEIANARLNSEWIALTGSHTYAFQSSETGYALTMPNASLGTQLIQSQYTSATDQQWTFSQWNAVGEYYAINASSKDSLFYDGTYNGSIKNPPVVQSAAAPYPSCSASAWRFVSAGDGSYYIVGVTSYNSGSCALMWFSNTYYSMTPQSTSSGAGIEASSLLNSSAQRWRVIVVK